MKIAYASKIELCEVHHAAIINKLATNDKGNKLENLVDLIKVVLQPHDNCYQVKVSNSGKAIIINRTKEFASELNIEQDFIILRRRYK